MKPTIVKISKQGVSNILKNRKSPYISALQTLKEGEGIKFNSREFQRSMNLKSIKNIGSYVRNLGKELKSNLGVLKTAHGTYLIYKK